MEELYKIIGAKFLTDAMFTVQVQTSLYMSPPETHLPKEYIVEKLNHEMIRKITDEMFKKFQKEIKIENVGGFGERHTLEFFAFPKTAFKLMVEYIISEMPENEINRIRNK